MLARILLLILFGLSLAGTASARVLSMKAARVSTEVAQLEGLTLRLEWLEGDAEGQLQLHARQLDAGSLGYKFQNLHWRCPLRRAANNGWHCSGQLRAGELPALQLVLHLDDEKTWGQLGRGRQQASFSMHAATPDLARIDLQQLPLKWLETWLAAMLDGAQVESGAIDGEVALLMGGAALQAKADLQLGNIGLQSADGSLVVAGLDGRLRFDYRHKRAAQMDVQADFSGELLYGAHYLALTQKPVHLALQMQQDAAGIWQLPQLFWKDANLLEAEGSIALDAGGELERIRLHAQSADVSGLPARYLSGVLGQLGLADLQMQGALQTRLDWAAGHLQGFHARLDAVDVKDPQQRFGFERLAGDIALSADENVDSTLGWQRAEVLGLVFDPAKLDFRSHQGVLGLRQSAELPIFDGRMQLHDLRLQPAGREGAMQMAFGLDLEQIDIGKMSKSLGLPEFRGELNGEIPRVVYANDRIDFDGGLAIGLFEGAVQITALSMERPFGTAPTLSADIDFNDLDLLRLTEVFGFGSISGRLDGHLHGLRLVDWQPVRFDARLVTERKPGVRQRISQRAVQNISSVGDATFMTSLQNRLIGLFDDFGYVRIGIACRLENEVCQMAGLDEAATADSAKSGFTIVKGSGLPRLEVIGHNRRVDWPTLLERLQAAGSGEIEPVIE
ncbi:hypothetical protein CO609_03165 [Lysobacteraceae bacterium NML91-0268]|nr:hypothetical protein CO609_03165 [Xanthomonadaceae bacterium NML91-0268]